MFIVNNKKVVCLLIQDCGSMGWKIIRGIVL